MYQLLRNFTSPVVAITSERAGKRNGMISDSAARASIVPTIPRLSVYVHKFNLSHDMIYETGRLVLHLLRQDQFDLIHRLGFVSGRTTDKLADVPSREQEWVHKDAHQGALRGAVHQRKCPSWRDPMVGTNPTRWPRLRSARDQACISSGTEISFIGG